MKAFCDKELKSDYGCTDHIVSIEVYTGYPVEEIFIKADELDCDLIVMGIHSKGFIKHTFLGSTAKRVIRQTKKPVFIIPLPEGETDITFHDN